MLESLLAISCLAVSGAIVLGTAIWIHMGSKELKRKWAKGHGLRFNEVNSGNGVDRDREFQYEGLKGMTSLVTGGNGFLGRHLAEKLLQCGCNVVVFDIKKAVGVDGAKIIVGDLRNPGDVARACDGVDIVFHCASPDPLSTNQKVLREVNVMGTKNLLDACAAQKVSKVVFTSSASVVFDGKDQEGVDESTDYPSKFRDPYSESKAIAEKLVLEANGHGMHTVALRPHALFGPGDAHFFTTLAANAERGKTKFLIGDGSNIADFTYVGNAVHAHMLAAERIEKDTVQGNAFFITNNEPLPFWDMISLCLLSMGYPAPYLRLPYSFCLLIGALLDTMAIFMNITPLLTVSKVQLAGLHHYYSCEKAIQELEYRPLWSLKEGIAITTRAAKAKPDRLRKNVPNFYTMEEVAKHNTSTDAWFTVDGKVYDITEYVDDHPGGDTILKDVGGDASKGFHGPQHPTTVNEHIMEYFIGELKTE